MTVQRPVQMFSTHGLSVAKQIAFACPVHAPRWQLARWLLLPRSPLVGKHEAKPA